MIDGDDYVFVRKVSESYHIFADRVVSDWQPFPGIRVTSVVVPTEYGHMRIHEVESAYDCTAMTVVLPWRNLQKGTESRQKERRPPQPGGNRAVPYPAKARRRPAS